MPPLSAWAAQGTAALIKPAFPAVTCTAQADYLTGHIPTRHGIVGNGWYSREDCEVRFWKQSNPLVQAPKIWDAARAIDPSFTVREPVLVVQHVFDGGLLGHAAADVSGRRPQAPGRLHDSRHAARRAAGGARHLSAVRVLGAARVDHLDALDRRSGQARRARSTSRR